MTQQEVHDLIREHGGIVHGDGNIFFTNAVQFGLVVAAMKPEPTQEYAHMQMAARAEAARVDELDSCRKQDETLIRQLVEALTRSQKYDDSDYAALAAGAARLGGKP